MSKENKAKNVVDKFMSLLEQELEGKIDSELDPVLQKFSLKTSRKSWKMAQQWCPWDDSGPILFPNRTRIFYRKGKTEVILQEFEPQVKGIKAHGKSYALAFPYVIFVYQFVDGIYNLSRVAFSDRPLQALDERPMIPYLTNIDGGNLKLCEGKDFDKKKLQKGNYNQQIAYILDYFWNSHFNNDWPTNYEACKNHFSNDPRLSSYEAWHEATKQDKLFVIDDVKWKQSDYYKSFGDMLVRCFNDDSHDSQFRIEIYESINEQLATEAKKAFKAKLGSIKDKILDKKISKLTELL